MRRIMLCVLALAASCAALAQTPANYLTITTTNPIVDPSGSAIPTGTFCAYATDAADSPIAFSIGGTQQVVRAKVCRPLVAGQLSATLQLANPAVTSPTNIRYHVMVTNTATGQVTQYPLVFISVSAGVSTWDWASWNPALNGTTLPVGPSITDSTARSAAAAAQATANAALPANGATSTGSGGANVVTFPGQIGTPSKVTANDTCGVSDLADYSNINAACFAGATPEAKINAGLNFMYTTMGLSTGVLNTCKLGMTGSLTLTADPFASVRSASSNFQVHLKYCGSLLIGPNLLNGTYTGGQLGFVLPGGMVLDGDSTHALPSPPYPNPEGATIQPANAGYTGPLISMGANADNNNPMGVRIKGMAISCLAPGETYTTSTFNITAWSITGASVPYTACFTTSAQSVRAGQLFSLSGFGTTTAFNGILGAHLIAQSTGLSSTQVCALTDVTPGSATEAGVGTIGPNTTAVLNANAQELSKMQDVNIGGCTVGYDNEIDPLNGVGGKPHSGFDSLGMEGVNVTLPKDPNAVGAIVGVFSPSQMSDFGPLKGMTIQGSNSGGGPSTGTGIWIENASRGRFSDIHVDYIPYIVEAGTLASTNTLLFENVVNGSSNSTYSWQNGYYIGPKFGYALNILGGSMLGIAGTGAVTLYDATYPGAPCSLLASNESSIGWYSKGFGGGVNQVISSTARTACKGSVDPLVAMTNANLTFTGATNYQNGTWHAGATGSTVGTNYGSNIRAFDVFCGSCGTPATYAETDFLSIAAGATPGISRYFSPPPSPPGSTIFHVGGTSLSWTELQVGNATNTTISRFWGPVNIYNAAGTFPNTITAPTNTATRTVTLADGPMSWPVSGAISTTAVTSEAFTIQGMTASGHCQLTATNASAATNIATTYISAKAANQITVTHVATASMTYDVNCSPI